MPNIVTPYSHRQTINKLSFKSGVGVSDVQYIRTCELCSVSAAPEHWQPYAEQQHYPSSDAPLLAE